MARLESNTEDRVRLAISCVQLKGCNKWFRATVGESVSVIDRSHLSHLSREENANICFEAAARDVATNLLPTHN